METNLDKAYWSERYKSCQTGWDVGYCTPAIKDFIDSLSDKHIKILIPGAGNAYEAEYLHKQGFTNVWVVDIAQEPIDNLLKRLPDFPKEHAVNEDFFKINDSFDLIIEQTFFCALSPHLREPYTQKMYELLKPGGKLVGVMFNKLFDFPGPPFGGTKEEYLGYFNPVFSNVKIQECPNSIAPRSGNEFWVELVK